MDIGDYEKKIRIARSISEEFEEPYKSISFKIILNRILDQELRDISSIDESLEEYGSSLIDFIREKKANNHFERILCMAYYLYKFKNIDPFDLSDIKKAYLEARAKEPVNISDYLSKIEKSRGFLRESGKKEGLKAYSLTIEGIEYVENLGGENE